MEYYAKSKNKYGYQETLEHHLTRTAELAKTFVKEFDNEEIGYILGMSHDIGKMTKLFAGVLEGTEHHINHAAAGAFIISKKINKYLGYIIIAHHSELSISVVTGDDINNLSKKGIDFDSNNLRYSTKDNEEMKNMLNFLDPHINLNKKINLKDTLTTTNQFLFYLRMLYSCLVDADFSSSAECDKLDYLEYATGIELNPDKLIVNLNNYRNNILSHSNPDNKMNILRNRVYTDCIDAALKNPGLFTLTAPTGTAKTLAMLGFALTHAEKYDKKRIFFILPMLSIIEQSTAIYKEICGNDYVLEDDSQSELTEQEREFATRWSSPITVTTSVKFFELLFQNKNSKCRKLHNLANSIIIFDEAQSLPPEVLETTLDIINVLCKEFNCTVLFSTATPPSFGYREGVDWKLKINHSYIVII